MALLRSRHVLASHPPTPLSFCSMSQGSFYENSTRKHLLHKIIFYIFAALNSKFVYWWPNIKFFTMKKIYILSLLTACFSLALPLPYTYGAAQPKTAHSPYNTALTTTLPPSGKMMSQQTPPSLSQLIELGDQCHDAAQYYQAIQYYEAALENYAQNSDKNRFTLSQIYHNLGMSYVALKLYDQAHFYYNESLKIRQALFPNAAVADHKTLSGAIGRTYHNLGALYLDTYKPKEAIHALKASLNTEWQHHVEAVDTKFYLATAYQQVKRYQESKALYEAILAQQKKVAYLNHKELQDVAKRLRQVNEKMEENQPTYPSITQSNTQAPPQLDSALNNPPPQAVPRLNPTIGVKKVTQKETVQPHQAPSTTTHLFSCDVCGKGFKHQSSVTRHMRVHTGEKPFQCAVCQRKFSLKHHMKGHMRTHTGEKPFQCAICQRKFSLKHSMQRHMHVHTGERRFQCAFCQRKFSLKQSMQKHMRVHTGEKPFQCTICQRKFSIKQSMKRHVTSIHKKATTCSTN